MTVLDAPPSTFQVERLRAEWARIDDGVDWPSLGGLACAWIEQFCIRPTGDDFGLGVELTEFQRLLLYRWFEYREGTEDGHGRPRWRWTELVLGLPRGEAKSTLCGWLGAIALVGPLELRSPVPDVAVAAASFEQADIAYGMLI